MKRIAVDAAAAALEVALADQPWWRRYAGTVTGALTFAAYVATGVPIYVSSAPEWVLGVAGVVVTLGGILGQRATPNGITRRGTDRVEAILDSVPAEGAHRWPGTDSWGRDA